MLTIFLARIGPICIGDGMGSVSDSSAFVQQLQSTQKSLQKNQPEGVQGFVTLDSEQRTSVNKLIETVDKFDAGAGHLQGTEIQEARAHLASIKQALQQSNGTAKISDGDFKAMLTYIKDATSMLQNSANTSGQVTPLFQPDFS